MRKDRIMHILFVCIILILVLVFLGSGLMILESTVFSPSRDDGFVQTRKTIMRDGKLYFPRQDITVLMILGIDQEGKVQASEEGNHGNAVDMVTVLIADEQAGTYSLININRDTMLDMPALDEHGREVGTYFGQLAYSHTYGTGVEDSCENTRKTISNFLYGITIDHYIAMNMEAVPILNDAVGGVTVNVVDDFSQVDPEIRMGEYTLVGEKARTFVQERWYVSDHLNIHRVERQKEYMQKFADAFIKKADSDPDFVLKVFEEVSDYIVTDCSATTLSNLFSDFSDYTVGEVLSLEGENVLGEQFYEFYPDKDKLDDLIVRLFYAPKR